MIAAKVRQGRWQIVRIDRGQRQLAVLFLWQRGVVIIVAFKPYDGGTQHRLLREHVLYPRLDGAEVLTDDHRTGALRF